MRDAISHTIFEARLKIDIKASFARGCMWRSALAFFFSHIQ